MQRLHRCDPSHPDLIQARRAGTRGSVDPALLVNDIEAMLLAAKSGFGLARALSYQVVDELEAGSLVRLLREFEPVAEPVHIVFSGSGTMRPSVRGFVDFAAAYLQKLSVIR